MEGSSENTAEVVQLDSSLWRRLLSGDDESAFFESWLALQARQLPSVRNATLVVADQSGKLIPRAFWPQGAAPGAAAMKAAQSAAKRKSGVVRREVAEGLAAFAYPVTLGDDVLAVSAFTLALQGEPQLQEALRRVQWGSVWLESRFAAEARDELSDSAGRLLSALELIGACFDHKSAASSALAFTTEAAGRLGASRVSLGRRGHGPTQISSISHVAKPDRRQGLVRNIVGAMDEALDQGGVIVFDGSAGDEPTASEIANAVTVRHRELSRAAGTGGPIITVPLHDEDRWIGAITAEFPDRYEVDNNHVGLIEAAGLSAARILDLRRKDERWLVTKAANAVWVHAARLLGYGYLGRKLALLAVLAATVFFWVYTTEFRLPAKAVIEADVQRIVGAPIDGYITDSFARAGDLVAKDQLLATLDDSDLQLELAAWQNRRAQYEAERQSALAERDIARARVFDAQIAEAAVQIELARSRVVQSEIRAPFDGIILTGDLTQALGSGVRLGDPLFQIAPLDNYRVTLHVLEDDINHVAEEQTGSLVLSASPDRQRDFTVTRITPVTVPEEGRNSFLVEARLAHLTADLRPGMEGTARINTDEARLIWIWTRRAQSWLRMQLWRWTP